MSKSKIRKFIKKNLGLLVCLRNGLSTWYDLFVKNTNPKKYGEFHETTKIGIPIQITNIKNVFLSEKTRINSGCTILTYTGKFYLKKYSAIGAGTMVITGNHIPTVGIPHYILGRQHVNDKECDIIVEEDVWVGANVTLLAGSHISRGCIIGACSLVNKEIPPYAVAVGIPTKIIASKFSIEQIIEHEKKIYPEEERYSEDFLKELFAEYYVGKRSIGLDS